MTLATTVPGSSTDCICGGCGWAPVDEEYVSHQAAKHRLPDGSVIPGTIEALRNSLRPCHECQSNNYELWRTGRFSPRTGSPDRPQRSPRRRARRRSDTDDGRF